VVVEERMRIADFKDVSESRRWWKRGGRRNNGGTLQF
jgi:hypothetical protein